MSESAVPPDGTGTAPAVRYGRVLLKISGEALLGDRPYGVDPGFCTFIATQVAFGLVAGFVVSRSTRIATFQHAPLAVRAGLETQDGDR